MAVFPKVLGGPILRRCTETMVTVWLATSVPLRDGLELDVYDAANAKAPKRLDVGSEHQVVRVGDSLFVHLTIARPKRTGAAPARFPRGSLLGYDLQVINDAVPPDSVFHRLPLSTLLTTEKLDYGTYPWPTFFLQADDMPLRALHGSCRRAYAAGFDAMAAPDTVIEASLTDVRARPALMILTGDQIYADDILWAMWSHTSWLARRLTGWDEMVPVDGRLQPLRLLNGRKELVLKNGLTTDDGENHLIGLSEFAAHYLINWSETLWDHYQPVYGAKRLEDTLGLIEVGRFQRTLPAVRRALANVPTYMIFDDHDVTDDWNLDQQWLEETTASPLGTRLITCALFAYWLFQGWGNDPDTFTTLFVDRVQELCDLFTREGGAVTAEQAKPFDDFIRQEVGPATGFGTRPSWSYVVPCTPPIFVLDTRTTRDLQVRGKGPGLVDKRGQEGLKRTLDAAKARGVLDLSTMPLVMVSATPFWPVQFIDLLQRRSIAGGGSSAAADLEFWRNNVTAHRDFLLQLVQRYRPASIVFLSGDVHYSFTGHTAIFSGGVDPEVDTAGKRRTGGKLVDIYQLTSSAFKNENSNAALSRHSFSDVASSFLTGVDIDNDWVNYLFDGQGDVRLDGVRFMDAVRARRAANSMVPQIFLMNIANMRGGPLLVPDYLFKLLTLKVEHLPRWREEVELHDHRGSSGADITAEANVGLITFAGQSVTHDLYGLQDPGLDVPVSRLAPRIWGPAGVRLRLGR